MKCGPMAAGLPESVCRHAVRAMRIACDLDNQGTLAKARQRASHSSPRTTELHDRTNDQITLDGALTQHQSIFFAHLPKRQLS